MNKVLNTGKVVKLLERIRINECVVFATYEVGATIVVDPNIDRLVRTLVKDNMVLQFRKRIPNSKQVALIAVGVTPEITKKLSSEVVRYEQKYNEQKQVQPLIDVEAELIKIFG
jgi:hypothetical protein